MIRVLASLVMFSVCVGAELAQASAQSSNDDVPLGGNREPTIAVNPTNPLNLAYSSMVWSDPFAISPCELRVSNDGGLTWEPPVDSAVPPSVDWCCADPCVAYDSQGRLFWTYLGAPQWHSDGGDLYLSQCDPATGAILPGYPVNVTESIGLGEKDGHIHHKQWLTSDNFMMSTFRDRLYLAWSEKKPARQLVRTSFSADQGLTWSAAQVLSDSGEKVGSMLTNTVAPDGGVYVAYHEQSGFDISGTPNGISGQVFVCRSENGGDTYPLKTTAYLPGQSDMTWNLQTTTGKIPGATFLTIGSVVPWVLADPYRPGRIYVIACDDPDNDNTTADYADVFIAISEDHGTTWHAPKRIDSSPGTSFQVMATASIDAKTGFIVAHYYDHRNGLTNSAGNYLLDVFTTFSMDGGRTFVPDVAINDVPFDPDAGAPVVGDGLTTSIGEYNGVGIDAGIASAVWCGNTYDGTGIPVGQQATFDSYRVGPALSFNGTPKQGESVNFTVTGATPSAGFAQVLLSCSGIDGGIPLKGGFLLPVAFDGCTLTSLSLAPLFTGVIDDAGRADTPSLLVPPLPPGISIYSAAFTWDTRAFFAVTPAILFVTQ